MNSKWIEMLDAPIGKEGTIIIFRTKKSGEKTETTNSGYGYFAMFKSMTKNFKVKLPLKLSAYLRQKIAEYRTNSVTKSTFSTDNADFTFVNTNTFRPGVGDIQLQVFSKDSFEELTITLTIAEVRQFLNALELVMLLLTNQPDRDKTVNGYESYLTSVFNWITAKVAYDEVLMQMGDVKPTTQAQFDDAWGKVIENRFVAFHNKLDETGAKVKIRIPIFKPYATIYNDQFAKRGFDYTKPPQEWEPVQLLVSLIISTCCNDNTLFQ